MLGPLIGGSERLVRSPRCEISCGSIILLIAKDFQGGECPAATPRPTADAELCFGELEGPLIVYLGKMADLFLFEIDHLMRGPPPV